MTQNILLIARRQDVIDEILRELHVPGFQLQGGTNIKDVRSAFDNGTIDHVILGGGIELEDRLDIVREIFHLSNATKVHMNSRSGPQSYLPFIESVLYGLKESE
jgi:DNA-binding response OmpR family regulator